MIMQLVIRILTVCGNATGDVKGEESGRVGCDEYGFFPMKGIAESITKTFKAKFIENVGTASHIKRKENKEARAPYSKWRKEHHYPSARRATSLADRSSCSRPKGSRKKHSEQWKCFWRYCPPRTRIRMSL